MNMNKRMLVNLFRYLAREVMYDCRVNGLHLYFTNIYTQNGAFFLSYFLSLSLRSNLEWQKGEKKTPSRDIIVFYVLASAFVCVCCLF